MSITGRVVWQEGMFLRAQHFQQQDRWVEQTLRGLHAALGANLWGVNELQIDRGNLGNGKFIVTVAAGLFPDGTPFSFPNFDCDPPPALELPETARDLVLYLGVPAPAAYAVQVVDPDHPATRLNATNLEAVDTHSGSPEPAALVVGHLRLQVLRADQDRAGYSCIPIARVSEVSPDRRITLDDRFMASALCCRAAQPLKAFLSEIVAMINQLSDALASRMAGSSARALGERADFLILQMANRWVPLLRAWSETANVHPERFFEALVQIAGEWASFTGESRRAAVYPPYRHHDLLSSFAPVIADLRRLIPGGIDPSAVEIPLVELRYGVRRGAILDRGLLKNALYLVVRANRPGEDLRRSFPTKVKIGPFERMQDLVGSAVSGIQVRPLPQAPRQLPFIPDAHYFELDRGSFLFPQMENSAAFGIHYSDERSDMEMKMQLWSVRA
jgi:type VI secretion system protein ImpJ